MTVRIQYATLTFPTSMVKWDEETKKILVPCKKVVVTGTPLDYNGTKEIKGGTISIK